MELELHDVEALDPDDLEEVELRTSSLTVAGVPDIVVSSVREAETRGCCGGTSLRLSLGPGVGAKTLEPSEPDHRRLDAAGESVERRDTRRYSDAISWHHQSSGFRARSLCYSTRQR